MVSEIAIVPKKIAKILFICSARAQRAQGLFQEEEKVSGKNFSNTGEAHFSSVSTYL